MNIPVVVPQSDDVKPCAEEWQRFLSPHPVDHAEVKILCRGSKKYKVPPCPFFGWCIQEREETQRVHGRVSVEGTWHGTLFVDGVANKQGRKVRARAGAL